MEKQFNQIKKYMFCLLFFSSLLGLLVVNPVAGYAASAQSMAEQSAQKQVETYLARVRMYHDDMQAVLLEVLKSPLFRSYFSQEESRQNRYSKEGVLQLSHRQHALREEIENIILEKHKTYPIGETCLVDKSGQEHLRVMHEEVEEVGHFSDSESASPFFEPSLSLSQGQIHLSAPYMSPDTHEWVVAFSSPVVMPSQEKTAFLHMEVPLSFYQTLTMVDNYSFSTVEVASSLALAQNKQGRFIILDDSGHLLADSKKNLDFKSRRQQSTPTNPLIPLPPEDIKEYAPLMTSLGNSSALHVALKQGLKERSGQQNILVNNRPTVMVYRPLPDRPWIVVYLE